MFKVGDRVRVKADLREHFESDFHDVILVVDAVEGLFFRVNNERWTAANFELVPEPEAKPAWRFIGCKAPEPKGRPSYRGYVCSLHVGHDGEHVATSLDEEDPESIHGEILASWEAAPTTNPRKRGKPPEGVSREFTPEQIRAQNVSHELERVRHDLGAMTLRMKDAVLRANRLADDCGDLRNENARLSAALGKATLEIERLRRK